MFDDLPLARSAQLPVLTMGILKKIAFVSAATVAAGMIAKAASSKKAPKALAKAKTKVKAAASEVTAKAKTPRKRKSAAKRTSAKTATA